MLKIAYKTEIKPNDEQKVKIDQNIGVCRFLYNSYIVKNKKLYQQYKDSEIEEKKSFYGCI